MLTKIPFLILITIVTATSLDQSHFSQCFKTLCTKERVFCQSDSECNKYLLCFDNCSPTDLTCLHKCSMPMLTNHGFWSLNLCAIECLKEANPAHQMRVEACEQDQCFTELESCHNSVKCKDAIQCLDGCKKNGNDYICAGKCFTDRIGETSIMFSLVHCKSSCVWKGFAK